MRASFTRAQNFPKRPQAGHFEGASGLSAVFSVAIVNILGRNADMNDKEEPALDPAYFDRSDNAPDEEFYAEPRMVVHLDDYARAALAKEYSGRLTRGDKVLDLMSSISTHLPEEHGCDRVAGLGMNAKELEANPQLSDWVVHNLNTNPTMPFEDSIFDACLLAVSVQYLIKPIEVFRDVGRVLRPGGIMMVSFSNRCFPLQGGRDLAGDRRQAARRDRRALFQSRGRFQRACHDRPLASGRRPGPALDGGRPPGERPGGVGGRGVLG